MNLNLIEMSRKYGGKPVDTDDDAFIMQLILFVSLSCCLCGVLWSLMYYWLFGYGLTAILPFAFVVIVDGAIVSRDPRIEAD